MTLPGINPGGSYGRAGCRDIAPFIRAWFVEKNGLDIGCGWDKIVPWAIGIDGVRGKTADEQVLNPTGVETVNIVGDACDLSMFTDESLDFVFSSHMLEHIPKDLSLQTASTEWMRVLKVGGLLVLYLPDGNVWETDLHMWNPVPEDFTELFPTKEMFTWVPKDHLRDCLVVGTLTHSFLVVVRK